jgi:hypothetical protein
MYDSNWVAGPDILDQDDALQSLVIKTFEDIYQHYFADDPLINQRLPVEIRALRDIDEWRVFLLLTPWMLTRIYLSSKPASITVPSSWSATFRSTQSYLVMGPQISFNLLQRQQVAHLNYHPHLGHHLMQPLILRMQGYDSAAQVYHDWNGVIETRNENIKKRHTECRYQEEISRREFFDRMRH